MLRRFMSPAEILYRSPDDGGGAGGAAVVTLDTISKAMQEVKTQQEKALTSIQKKYDDLLKEHGETAAVVQELKEALKVSEARIKEVNTYMDQLALVQGAAKSQERKKHLAEEIGELIEKHGESIAAGRGKKTPIEFETKGLLIQTKADMSFGNNTTGTVVAPDFNSNLYAPPLQTPHMRTFIPVGTTSGQVYFFVQAKLKDGSPTPGIIAAGATKTQVEFQLTGVSRKVLKIAGYSRLPEEMLEDIEGMTSFLQTYLPEEVLNTEDTQILTGTGDANNQFDGLLVTSPVHTPTAGVDPNEMWDLLADANAQLQNLRFYPTRIMVNPIDWARMITRKSTDGVYSHPTLLLGLPLLIAGVPVIPHPEIPVDKYLIGRFTSVELKVRRGLTVRFFDQDQDNAIKNMVTVVAEERAAFANYYPEAFLQGDFGNVA